jgi:uncharacterized membrane protein
MAVVFLFLSFDELFAVHERLMQPVLETFDLPGFLQFAWVPVYAILVMIVALVFLPLWRSLEHGPRWTLTIAGAAYLAGAVGFETLGGAVYTGTEGDVLYGVLYTMEESLEMLGLVALIYGLLLILSGSVVRIGDSEVEASPLATLNP